MWKVIILIVVLIVIGILIRFFYDIKKQKEYIARQGGMHHKYRKLIEYMKRGNPRARIYKVT